MPKTIISVQVTYSDGTSASLTQNEFTSPFAPGGKIVLDKPKYTNGPDIAADPGSFDGDPASDPTLTWAPQFWEGNLMPPYPPMNRMCDMFRADPDLARAVWRKNYGAPLDESKFTAAQRKRCGL